MVHARKTPIGGRDHLVIGFGIDLKDLVRVRHAHRTKARRPIRVDLLRRAATPRLATALRLDAGAPRRGALGTVTAT